MYIVYTDLWKNYPQVYIDKLKRDVKCKCLWMRQAVMPKAYIDDKRRSDCLRWVILEQRLQVIGWLGSKRARAIPRLSVFSVQFKRDFFMFSMSKQKPNERRSETTNPVALALPVQYTLWYLPPYSTVIQITVSKPDYQLRSCSIQYVGAILHKHTSRQQLQW